MKPEEQRIAIAEWCGFVSGVEEDYPYRREWAKDGRMYCDCDLPDYLNDLDAMWEAENRLDNSTGRFFIEHLCQVRGGWENNTWFDLFTKSTAAQRAEALLRTIGKWTPTDQRKDRVM